MKRSIGAVVALVALVVAAALRRRPVKPPAQEGTWQPVHRA